ncbi:site-specific integrase [uncultured Methylophaga sp.]|uniref:tyrosine-type recombinase/integrase n=1 Tax=uncultured Methylophaga sp. TaxID=285271 RepID=UPI00259D1A4E|nr:site-specific integrase [uncultured Methylophaga sp.]|tara:strand:+ start:26881 stop:28098 length:1218 start_codon:yes stop_codon:yes gene_type:complete
MTSLPLPKPIFDTLDSLEQNLAPIPSYVFDNDFAISREFLLAYRDSPDTFNSYRREVERFLQWVYRVAQMNLYQIGREDIENFIRFCQQPPDAWIATKMVSKFIDKEGIKQPNPDWRPFVVKVTKEARQNGKEPIINNYRLSDQGIRAILRILSTYFTFLEMEDYVQSNPVKRVRQKSRLIRTQATQEPIRRLSELQWDYVIETAEAMANEDPLHERTLFIMSALYGMYLRISELVDTSLWSPMMKHFYQDYGGNWWFKTVSKGNKERDISVSSDMLAALKRYRRSMDLSAFPSPGDNMPLISKQKGKGGISSTRQLRDIVQVCFDNTISRLREHGMESDAENMQSATVHWLRHTGISDDVKKRPKEHVRDDAGHSSSAITDRYIDIEKRERHASAKKKKMRPID